MEFEAEWSQSDCLQSALHHLKRGHLLGHEQHTAPAIERIGNYVGDGLRLAGARRAVENKAAAVGRRTDGFELRRIGSDGQGNLPGRKSPVEVG